jgi:hypothetical protein
VPIYQSEVSPPNHVSLPPLLSDCPDDVQRGALACMEFTGNIIGYSCSVVSLRQVNFDMKSTHLILVDGLLLLLHGL